jgi:hypothetical protein
MSTAATEQITLDSGEVNIRPTEQHLNTITSEILQVNKNKKLQKLLQVYDDKILCVTQKFRKKKSTVLINLIMLDETPKRKRNINMGYLFTSIGFTLATYLVFYLKSKGLEFLASPYTYAVMGVLALVAILVFGLLIKSFQNSLVFLTRHGHVPAVELFHNYPDKAQYQQFISRLSEKIAAVHNRYPIPESKLLPAELGETRRLRDAGFISAKDYETAKSRVLGNH